MYTVFSWVFISTLAAKTLAVLLRIVEQSRADIFIMDWEGLARGRKALEDEHEDKD